MSLKNKKLWTLFLDYLNNSNEEYTFNFNNHEEQTDLMKLIQIYLKETKKNIYEELPDDVFNLLLQRIELNCSKIKKSLYNEILINNTHTKITDNKNIIICTKNSIMELNFLKSLTSYKQNLIKNSLEENNFKLTNQYIKKYIPGSKMYAVFNKNDIDILSQKNIIKEYDKNNFYKYCE